MKDKLPIVSEAKLDREFREYIGEFSRFPAWDKMHSEEYTEADRKTDLAIERRNYES